MLNLQIKSFLKKQGLDFIHFVDISNLPQKQNQVFSNALLLGIALSPEFIRMITEMPDYVDLMVRTGKVNSDEYVEKEAKVDYLADELATFLIEQGYNAYSQSENNLDKTGFYNTKTKTSPLPHKTIAGLAGLGWIGKHNLLVTPNYGSAICMCTVLTDAPLATVSKSPQESKCGDCSICMEICTPKAIKGNHWKIDGKREDLVDVFKCTQCLKCLVFCPWTQKYAFGQ
ncbi:MAG: epoxyqueuosine reductase [Candidatus Cloacimonetes bacterium]|nr:epoxyqueuosine reductase [Candidatus Cloacimonadota bacterium]MCF7812943.1 epoxyqueuosine reductase [Candidatus Cloacimonadota bacterium]MCF7867154.1 epoxyqueuosine reductase [Candidatus Cloacimonadota bacterium]MCF7882526.1 epoxyqueuosine reductase [Candidatus Cloacimonadota bacterium]